MGTGAGQPVDRWLLFIRAAMLVVGVAGVVRGVSRAEWIGVAMFATFGILATLAIVGQLRKR